MEQHPVTGKTPAESFEVGLYELAVERKATIPSCSQLLDVALGGKVAAVVREKQIELWDTATIGAFGEVFRQHRPDPKKLKAAPFKYTRIDAAQFSPDGKLLAISDRNELLLWRWEEDTHERIDLGQTVGSLAFSPDGKLLAEGPTPGENIQIRSMETRKVVQTLANSTKLTMNVPRMAFTQGGRVLIACDNITHTKEAAATHRIKFWDVKTGAIAQQIAVPAGLPINLDVTPNGKYMAAMLDDGDAGMKLSAWRLDGEKPVVGPAKQPPASVPPK
jgi:WD40 repeat protein